MGFSKIADDVRRAKVIVREQGGAYLVRRMRWKAQYKRDTARRIEYDEWRSLNKLTVTQARRQRKKSREVPAFLVAIDTDEASSQEIIRTKECVKHQTWLPVKVFTGNREYIKEHMNAYLADKCARDYWVSVLCAGDVLEPDFFYRIGEFSLNNSECGVVYTDREVRKEPLKGNEEHDVRLAPDYSLDYLCASDYIGTSFCARADLLGEGLEKITWHPYLFLLDMAGWGVQFGHVQRLLYHQQMKNEKPCRDEERIDKAVRKAYETANRDNKAYTLRRVDVLAGPNGVRRVFLKWEQNPRVSVIIPNKDHAADLCLCLRSLQKQTVKDRLEVLIVENNSTGRQIFDFYEWLKGGEMTDSLTELELEDSLRTQLCIKVLYWDREFNYSAINNFAKESASGELLLLLNNDVELIGEDAVEWLISSICQDNTGVVGAKLYYEDETVQHGGVIIGFGGVAGHAFTGISMYDSGYMKMADCARRLGGVTAACMLVRKEVYERVCGLDEGYAVAFNDVDFCMKVSDLGIHILYQPACEGWHAESKSRGQDLEGENLKRFQSEIFRFMGKWDKELKEGDKYYNRNLSLTYNDYHSYREPYAFD